MRKIVLLTATFLMPVSMSYADDSASAGTFLGHDGKLWRMEGCAAYPVEPQAGASSAPVVADKTPEQSKKLAQSKPAKSE